MALPLVAPMVANVLYSLLTKRPTLRHHGWCSMSAMSASENSLLLPSIAPALLTERVIIR